MSTWMNKHCYISTQQNTIQTHEGAKKQVKQKTTWTSFRVVSMHTRSVHTECTFIQSSAKRRLQRQEAGSRCGDRASYQGAQGSAQKWKRPASQLWTRLHGYTHVETPQTAHLEWTQFILCWLLSFLYKWSEHSNYKSEILKLDFLKNKY